MHEREHSNPSQAAILVVEDSPQSTQILQRILTRHGYAVQIATSGLQALSVTHTSSFDAILLDIKMPEMDGFEICARLKTDERTRDIPIIFISALNEIFDKVKAFSVGGVDYITKPFHTEEVVARVEVHIKMWHIKRQLQKQNIQLQQEIHERERTEANLQRRNHELALINRVGQMLSSSLDLDYVLKTALEEIHRLLNVISTSFWLLDAETQELVCREAFGSGSETLIHWRLDLGQGITGWVAQHGESLLISDALKDNRHFTVVDQQTGLPVRSMLSIPLRVQGRVIGVLNLVDPRPYHFTDHDLRFVEPIATAAAIAIENAGFYMQSQQELLERRRIQEALQHAKDAAEAANRTKSIFLANINHEFRTPLNAILGFSQLLFRQQSLTSEQKEYAQIIYRNGENLLHLVNRVLDFSKIEACRMTLNTQDFDLFEMLDDLTTFFTLRAQEKRLTFHVFREPEVPQYIKADQSKLREVLFNLLNNAVKFTEKGDVTFRIDSCQLNQDRLQFAVSDTGQGIPSEEIDSLFEVFGRTTGEREPQGGAGVGLAISRKFVQIMGGKLTVESEPGQGSLFRVEIPIEIIEPCHIPPSSTSHVHPSIHNHHVMQGSERELSPADFAVFPLDVLIQLEYAAITTDFTAISQLLQQLQLQPERIALFNALTQLAQHFEYTQILTLVQEAQKIKKRVEQK